MKSKPVRKYPNPKYPTRLEMITRPSLFHRHQPPAWRKWPELTGAAGLFLLADTARLPAADGSPKGSQNPAQTNAVAVVAPIFQHGEGRGATGCIVMAPPVFLSEEEALQVIREEMTSRGVKLGTNGLAVTGVTLSNWPLKSSVPKPQDTYAASAADPTKKVFVEFISERKARHWDFERGKEEGNLQISSVQDYDMPKTAAFIAKRVKQQASDRIYFGTFYDPIAGSLDLGRIAKEAQAQRQAKTSGSGKPPTQGDLIRATREAGARAAAESRRLLRLQVQDFLKWLQAQGAI
jgi:hypothetical protein